ncbi:hypothetical protein EDC01DRAFT_718721 [Geopyxis carbonaria]|nr:hypothetical protein EDC01DRAFT_718721 [Geopyxis carbonaria]
MTATPPTSLSNPDPYPQFESELRTLLEATRLSFTSFLRIRSLAAATSPELLAAREELSDNHAQLLEDLEDLTATVAAVEHDPYRFGLDVADVAARRRFVGEVAGELEDMREEMERAPGTHATGAGATAGGAAGQGGFVGDSDDDDGADLAANDPVAQYEQQQQLEMLRRQDEQLEGVGRTVQNLKRLGGDLGRELEEQNQELEELDRDVERVEGKLQRGLKDLNRFVKKNEDSVSNWCIGLLIMILCVLLFFLIIL